MEVEGQPNYQVGRQTKTNCRVDAMADRKEEKVNYKVETEIQQVTHEDQHLALPLRVELG